MPDEIKIDSLPGDLKKVAALIGLDHTMKLVEHFGGGALMIPKCSSLYREIRNKKIRELYDSGGHSISQLARRFDLTPRQVSTVLSGTDEKIAGPVLDAAEKSTKEDIQKGGRGKW